MSISSGLVFLCLILSSVTLAVMAVPLANFTNPSANSGHMPKVNTLHHQLVFPLTSRPTAQPEIKSNSGLLGNRTVTSLEKTLNDKSTGSLNGKVVHHKPTGEHDGEVNKRSNTDDADYVVESTAMPAASDPEPGTNTPSFAPVFIVFLVSCGIAFLVSVHIVYLSLSGKRTLQTTPLSASHEALHGVQANSFDTTDGFYSPARIRTRRGDSEHDMIQMEVKRSTSGATLSTNSNSPPGCARPLELSFLFRGASYSPSRNNNSLAASTSSASSRSTAPSKPIGMLAFESVETDLL